MDIHVLILAATVVATAAPLLLAALGETLSEKSGVINLSLDGTILLAAMTGFAVAYETDAPLLGFAAAMAAGMAVAGLLSAISIWLGQSQVAVGFALTFLCRDLAYFLGNSYARQQGPQLTSAPIPLLGDLPVVGPVFFGHNGVVYCSFLAIPLLWFILYRTRFGLVLRAVGENPDGCWARGTNPRLVQTICTIAGGAMVGLAGAAYSLAIKPGWGRPQGCEGIGWIALALVIFGGWHPVRVALGAYLFGLLQILGIVLQDVFPAVPAQVFQVAPFPLMIFTLLAIHFCRPAKGQRRSTLFRLLSGDPPTALGEGHRRC